MCSVAQANIAFDPSGAVLVPGEPSGNDALFFTPNVNITVTELGYYDDVTYDHEVGLYTASGGLLASTTIIPGETPVNGFAYNPIAPVTLLAGQTYAVDGYYAGPPDPGVYATGGVGADPLITYDYYLYDYNPGFDLANVPYPTGIFGPNFQFSATPVPEPTTMVAGAMLLLPFGMSTLRMLRKSRTA